MYTITYLLERCMHIVNFNSPITHYYIFIVASAYHILRSCICLLGVNHFARRINMRIFLLGCMDVHKACVYART